MCEIIWGSAHKQLLLKFVLQSWKEICAHRARTSCGGFCLLRFRFNLGLSLMLVSVPRALPRLKTFEKISLSELQESCDDLRFKQRLSKLKQSLHSFYISGVYAAGGRRIMMGQIYEEMDRRACGRRREKSQLGQIKLRKSHLVQIGTKLSLQCTFRPDMSSEKDIILHEVWSKEQSKLSFI